MTDPIADMLNRIRNAQAVGLPTVVIPFSKIKNEIADILEKSGFVGKSDSKGRKTKKDIELTLNYKDGIGAISGLKRISKPGQRIYLPLAKIKKVKEGFGISIVSTSRGIMTGKEAWRQKLGGEIICEIW